MIRRDSYLRIGAELLGLLVAMLAVAAFGLSREATRPEPPPAPAALAPPRTGPKPAELPAPRAVPPPEPIVVVDLEAIARAEAEADAAQQAGLRAEVGLREAGDRLRSAQIAMASAIKAHRSLGSAVRDPTPRLASARARGELLKAERDKLAADLGALNASPKPRRKPLIDKSPVAKTADGEEFHFEIRRDRVAFIDLERLLDRVKTDARVQLRLTNGMKPASGTVGPIGAFSMAYEVSRLDDGSNGRMASFGLSGWEIIPEVDNRGETLAAAMGPASNFARALNRLTPSRDVVTLWIYPDGFPMYRQIREILHARGYLVAARPLPEGVAIKGSPSGSASSAQ